MTTRRVDMHGQVAISVGHVVEVRIYEGDEGVFGTSWVLQPHKPLVIDRTTGVVYGRDEHFLVARGSTAGAVRPELPLEVRTDLRERERFVGTVAACRIAFSGGGAGQPVQTSLLVEVTS